MTEAHIQRDIELKTSRNPLTRLFRNNVGMGWAGKLVFRASGNTFFKLQPGDIVLRNARPLRAGLCEGSSDEIGWHSILITPRHVGRLIARFTAVEVKTATGRPTAPQRNFIEVVNKAGGAAGIARSADEALAIIEQE